MRPVAFLHQFKCAGSSITTWLWQTFPDDCCWQPSQHRDIEKLVKEYQSIPEEKKKNLRLFTGHNLNVLFPHLPPDTLRLTVIREPVERALSHYYYALKTGHVDPAIGLIDYTRSLGPLYEPCLSCHEIGLYENLDKWCSLIAKKYGFLPWFNPHLNSTPNRPTVDSLSKDELQELREILKEDIRIYLQVAHSSYK